MLRSAYQILATSLQRGSDAMIDLLQGISEAVEAIFQLDSSLRLMDGSAGFFHGVSDICEWFLLSLEGDAERPLWLKILILPILIPYWIVATIYAILAYPFSILHLESDQLRNLYLGIPSMLAMALTLGTVIHASTNSKAIDDRYRNAMTRAMATGDFETAKILGGRLVSDRPNADPETRFSYAITLLRTGDMQQYQAVLANLAPSDSPGYAPAHRMRALVCVDQLKEGSSQQLLKQLRWHLENSGDEINAETERLWTAYYATIGQHEDAVEHLEVAAKIEPRNLLSLANLFAKIKNKSGENRALRAAEVYLGRRLKEDPLSYVDRAELAIVQSRLDKLDLAEETVLTGVKLLNDAPMRRLAADFYVIQHDRFVNENPEALASQFVYLEKALKLDCNHRAIYERLIRLSERSDRQDEREKVLELLTSMLASGHSVSLAHFALSGVYNTMNDPEKSLFHLDQSYSLDPNFPLVTNNLAWTIAHTSQPDLTRALALIEKALKASPNDTRFRDTRATILMKQGRTQEAIAAFEAILGTAPDKLSIHRKLAELYAKLDRHDMANVHSEKANELAIKLTAKRR